MEKLLLNDEGFEDKVLKVVCIYFLVGSYTLFGLLMAYKFFEYIL
ncbi:MULTISPECIES: hypothetical protein [unclassified Cetobacterium]|nr:hypothetical protein [Cetobacterium sp. 2A]